MLTFNLRYLNEARVWFQPNSDLLIDENNKESDYTFEGTQLRAHVERTVILELFLPRGGRIVYGVLGVNYRHPIDKKLSVKIHTTGVTRKLFKESLLAGSEKPYVGLTEEYSEGILSQLTQFHKTNKLLLGGELGFDYAVYGDVSSSSWIFQKLTYMLVHLVLLPQDTINREVLIELLEQATAPPLAV